MSTTPIIIETKVDLTGLMQTQQGLRDLAPAADTASASFHRVTAESSDFEHEISRVNSINTGAVAPFDEAAAGASRLGYSAREARGAARLLAEELGVHLNRELADTLARSALIGPALEGAFGVLAAAGFIEVIDQAGKKFNEFLANLAGWDKAQQEAYQRELDRNSELITKNIEMAARERALNTEGLEGSAKRAVQVKDLAAEQKDYASAVSGAMRQQQQLNAELEHWKGLQKIPFVVDQDLVSEKIGHITESIKRVEKEIDTANSKQIDIRAKVHEVDVQGQVDKSKERDKDRQAAIDSERSTATARAAANDSYLKAQYEAHHISLEQELNDLRDIEKEKLNAEREYTNRRIALLREQAQRGMIADPTAEITKLNADLLAKEEASKAKINELNTQAAQARIKSAVDTAREVIAANERISESETKLAEATQKHDFEHADNPAELEAAAIPYIKTVTAEYEKQLAAKKELITAIMQEVEAGQRPTAQPGTQQFQSQLAGVKNPEAVKALTSLNAEIITLHNQQATAVVDIEAQKQDKLEELGKQQVSNTMSDLQQKSEQTKNSYQEELTAAKAAFDAKTIDSVSYFARQKTLAEQNYADQVKLYEQGASAVREAAAKKLLSEQEVSKQLRDIYQRESLAYQQLMKQEQKATDEAVQHMQQSTDKFFNAFNSNITRMLTSNEKFSTAMIQTWNQMATQFIGTVLKMAEQWVAAEVIKLAASQSAQAQATASQMAQNAVARLDSAKTAAAAAMASTPFPLDLVVGPLVFAAALAFNKGGIVPGSGSGDTVPSMLAPREMVLPAHISTFIQSAAANAGGDSASPRSGTSSGGDTYHTTHMRNNFEIHNHGDKASHDDIVGIVKTAMRRGQIGSRDL